MVEKSKFDIILIVKICITLIVVFFAVKIIIIIENFLKNPVDQTFGLATKIAQELADDLKACTKKGLFNGKCIVGLSFLFYMFGGILSTMLTALARRSKWGKTDTADKIELRTGESAEKALQEETDANNELDDKFSKSEELREQWKNIYAEKLSKSTDKNSKQYKDAREKIDKLSDKNILDIIKSDATRRRISQKVIDYKGATAAKSQAKSISQRFTDWSGKLFGDNGIDPEEGKDAAGEIEMAELPKPPVE